MKISSFLSILGGVLVGIVAIKMSTEKNNQRFDKLCKDVDHLYNWIIENRTGSYKLLKILLLKDNTVYASCLVQTKNNGIENYELYRSPLGNEINLSDCPDYIQNGFEKTTATNDGEKMIELKHD